MSMPETPSNNANTPNLWGNLTRGWLIFQVLSAVIATFLVFRINYRDRLEAVQVKRNQLDPSVVAQQIAGAQPTRVETGIFVERIAGISIKDASWVVDFFIWFRWQGEGIEPGESFRVLDGVIEQKEKIREIDNGDQHYVQYRVVANITKFFDIKRFPLDDHLLTIVVVETNTPYQELEYVADTSDSGISARSQVAGYRIIQNGVRAGPFSYRNSRGDPNFQGGDQALYSQITFGLWVSRSNLGYYLKLFQGLFAAVAIAILGLLSRPTADPRFGLGVGAFFAAIANAYITSSLLPDVGILTLADVVNGLGMVTIFLILVQSTISLYIYDHIGETQASRRFDRISAAIFVFGYLAVNWAIILGARL